MKLSEFKIGRTFYMGDRKWLCTDVGTRTVAAICILESTVVVNGKKRVLNEGALKAEGGLNGPPYSLDEVCLDEYDIEACRMRLAAPRIGRRLRIRKTAAVA